MTRQDRERVLDRELARYPHVGASVVGDDSILCRLLQMLDFSGPDRDIGEYLCSLLRA